MPNYSMEYGLAEAAKILEVDRELLKTIAYKFSGYLTDKANPPKGQPRCFNLDDIRVLAYVLLYWEDAPSGNVIQLGV